MQFGILSANSGHGSTPEGAKALVQAAEAGGFTTAWTVEHVVVPSGYQSTYPYAESGKMAGGAEDFDLPDPLIWLTWAAAHTTTLRLGTGILIATQRNPVVIAKSIATLDVLSGGRLDVGVGVGWLEEEFDALSIPFARRGQRLDEYIDAMRALWTQDKASFHGDFANFDNCISRPRPVNGTVPIVIGGHTKAAARRAGQRGDAFFPGSATTEAIAELVDVMKQTATEHDRDGDAIPVYAMATGKPGDSMYARIDQLAALGVTQVIVPAYSPSRLVGIGEELRARFG
jgi:probable F420-dependent oxidoreductase